MIPLTPVGIVVVCIIISTRDAGFFFFFQFFERATCLLRETSSLQLESISLSVVNLVNESN